MPASFLADGPTTRTVRGVVIDKDGGLRPYTTSITVTNLAPTGTLANRSVQEGETATIGLTGVTDPSTADAAALRYAYDFQADGTWDVGSTTYANAVGATTADLPAALTADGPATRNVRVAVVDKDGGFTPYDATVTVTNVAPSATLANSGPVERGRDGAGLLGRRDRSVRARWRGRDALRVRLRRRRHLRRRRGHVRHGLPAGRDRRPRRRSPPTATTRSPCAPR